MTVTSLTNDWNWNASNRPSGDHVGAMYRSVSQFEGYATWLLPEPSAFITSIEYVSSISSNRYVNPILEPSGDHSEIGQFRQNHL